MQSAEFVLKHRNAPNHWVKLTTDPKGRKQWEFTERFREATTFESSADIDRRTAEHSVYIPLVEMADYVTQHSLYLRQIQTAEL